MFLIGILEFFCLVTFLVGLVWFAIDLFRKTKKRKPALIMIFSFVGLLALVMVSDVLYHDELEQSRIEKESREIEDVSKKIKELEEKNKQLEAENKKLEKENEELEKDKKSEIEIESKSKEKPESTTSEEYKESTSENITEPSETQTEEITSSENSLLYNLKKVLGDNVGNEAYDILVNQIGFTNLEYIENTPGTGNHTMSSSECSFVLTAFPDDKVYRIFQPNGGAVFYEDGVVKTTVEELKDKLIDHNDRSAYYIMAKSIVESGLKNPRSAKFPSIVTQPAEISMSKNGDVIAVQSYVDAQNSFGATVRNNWVVQFEVIDISTYSYNLVYVNVDGEKLFGEWIDME